MYVCKICISIFNFGTCAFQLLDNIYYLLEYTEINIFLEFMSNSAILVCNDCIEISPGICNFTRIDSL